MIKQELHSSRSNYSSFSMSLSKFFVLIYSKTKLYFAVFAYVVKFRPPSFGRLRWNYRFILRTITDSLKYNAISKIQ